MQALAIAVLLGVVLAFFSERFQHALHSALRDRPVLVFAAPLALTALFCSAAAAAGALGLPLALLALGYTLLPTLCAYRLGTGPVKVPAAADFLTVALLWLPLEGAAGASLVPRPAQGFLHSVAYGIAIVLALVLFAGFRGLPGMKCFPPRRGRDILLPLAGFAAAAPVLAAAGLALGFLPGPHLPAHPEPARMAARFALIFIATALPEELLFRSLVQNLLMLRFGFTNRVLLAAAAVFGCAHLNNGPQALPNWRYAIVAAIAGFAFGKVFQKAGTVLSPAACHALVNTVKAFFF